LLFTVGMDRQQQFNDLNSFDRQITAIRIIETPASPIYVHALIS